MYEIIESHFLDRAVLHPHLVRRVSLSVDIAVRSSGNVSPAALEDYSSVVSRIFDRTYLGKSACLDIAREYLAAHDFHARFFGRAARYRADAFAVVVLGGYHSCHVRAMSGVIYVIGSDKACVPHEIVSVPVSGISVAVHVLGTSINRLTRISPHVRKQVRMGEIHTLVKHRHNYGRVARTFLPGLLDLNVSTCD